MPGLLQEQQCGSLAADVVSSRPAAPAMRLKEKQAITLFLISQLHFKLLVKISPLYPVLTSNQWVELLSKIYATKQVIIYYSNYATIHFLH